MSLRELMEEDLDTVFFDPDDGNPEAATYNSIAVNVLPEIGRTLQNGNAIEQVGTSDRAIFGVRIADVAEPKANDVIIHKGKTWRFARLVSSEAGLHRIECVSNMNPHNLRR